MSTEERYNGWANRETWAVALHINNDQGWQESITELLTDARDAGDLDWQYRVSTVDEMADRYNANRAGEIIRDNVEAWVTVNGYREMTGEDKLPPALSQVAEEIGSLWRVDWTELGAAFLEDLGEEEATD